MVNIEAEEITGTLNCWQGTIKQSLREFAAIPFSDIVDMECKTVFDDAADIYMAIVEGWEGVKRLHGVIVHVEIKNDKIWIQMNGTEYGIDGELVEAGIAKDRIVLGFKSPRTRKYTEFAVAQQIALVHDKLHPLHHCENSNRPVEHKPQSE